MRKIPASTLSVFLLVGCQAGGTGGGDVALESDDQKASYAIGLNIGTSLETAGDHIQLDQLVAGLRDARAGEDPKLDAAEIQTVMTAFTQMIQAEEVATREADAQKNADEGASFLVANGAKDGITTTASGLQYEVLREGEGPKPSREDRVTINYRGTLIDGTEFDSSYGGEPATFSVSGVIDGFTESLLLMNVGSHLRVFMPGDIAYGMGGSGNLIGPNATLIFEIEMLEIIKA